MKKNWKKVLSLILALSMVLTMNTSVFATSLEGTDPAVAAAPAAETPAAEEPAQTPEAAPEATEPAPEATAPAAEETEAPAAAEEPAKAEEAAEAAKAEAPAAAPAPAAEAEQEDAAEGNELPGYVPSGTTLSSNILVQYEVQGSVVSDNSGNLTIKKNAIASLQNEANKNITVTLEEGAKVYVGRNVGFTNNEDTDRERVNSITAGTALKNVEFTGNGTIYLYNDGSSVSVNEGITVDISKPAANGNTNPDKLVVSAGNVYKFYNGEGDNAATSFTGLKGKINLYGLNELDIRGIAPYFTKSFAKEVSANKTTVSVNKDVYAYKSGKFELLSENSTINVGKDEGYNFGQIVFWDYKNTNEFYYTRMPAKPAQPDVSGVKLTDGKVLEGAWRKDGVDLDQVVKNILKYQKKGEADPVVYNGVIIGDIEFVLVKDGEAAPAQDAKGWAQKSAVAHAVFNSLADGSKISANDVGKTYKIYARNASYVTAADNNGFYSDPVEIGSFITKEIPATIEITIPSEIVYQGDAADSTGTPFYGSNYSAKFTEKGMTYDELKIGTDNKWGGIRAHNVAGAYDYLGRAVQIDGSTVGVLKNYVILGTSENKIDSASVNKMSFEDIEKLSKATLGGMKTLKNGNANGEIKYLSANKAGSKYIVKAFFELYRDNEYTNVYGADGDVDLPYLDGISSNAVELTVKQAKLKVVPDYEANVETRDKYNRYYLDFDFNAYSEDPQFTTISSNIDTFNSYIYAFDPDKKSEEGLAYMRTAGTRGIAWGYFDAKYYNGTDKSGIITGGQLELIDGDKKEAIEDGDGRSLSSNADSAKTYKLKVSANSLTWPVGSRVSENFIIDYDTTYTITVNPNKGGGGITPTISFDGVSFFGQAYYGSTDATVKARIYYDYTINGTKYWSKVEDGETGVEFGDLYEDEACTKKVLSENSYVAELDPGKYVYLSINKVRVISENGEYNKDLTGRVAKILIEPRPIDIYAHGYTYRGETVSGQMDSSEVYGDIIENVYEDSFGHNFYYENGRYNQDGVTVADNYSDADIVVDDYYNSKKANFQGADLMADSNLKAKNADLVDATETTLTWDSDWNEWNDNPVKLYLDNIETVKTKNDIKKTGSKELAANLSNRFYINTAVGYMTVLPKYTVTYMLQYEDPRKDGGKADDKLVAYEETKITKEQFKGNNNSITINPTANKEVLSWTKDGKGILNETDGDSITRWRYKALDSANNNWTVINAYDGNANVTGGDYCVTAVVAAYAGHNVYVESISPVLFNGLNHIADYATMNGDNYNLPKIKSSEAADLSVVVATNSGGATKLVFGKDYTISYKNNKDASVYYVDDGKTSLADKVKPKYTDKKKKPQVIIKGAGKYKGKFQATIYFDIYPTNIEGDGNGYIDSLGEYYNDGRSGLEGIKGSYLAKDKKAAKVSYTVKNVQYPSKVNLQEWADRKDPRYVTDVDYSKAKFVALKKGKDYAETIYRKDGTSDKNGDEMGWIPVKASEIIPTYSYKIRIRGIGNYTGTFESPEFTVYDQTKYQDLSKLKLTVPKTVNWETLMLNKDNSIRAQVDLEKLGIKVESKKKDSKKQKISFSGGWTYKIDKVNKAGQVERDDVVTDGKGLEGNFGENEFDDAGLYKLTIYLPNNGWGPEPITETIQTLDKDGKVIDSKTVTNRYVGTVEKTFTIKGVTLKASDFEIVDEKGKKATKLKWDGNNTNISFGFSKSTKSKLDKTPVFGKNQINKTYVDTYLKKAPKKAIKQFEPVYNSDKKRYEAYIRDWCLGATYYRPNGSDTLTYTKAGTTATAAAELANAINNYRGASYIGDVYYTDNGSAWTVGDQLDVYRFVFNSGANNKEVGTYTIKVPTDGIFGTDGLELKYQRTGTATKVLEVKKAK